MSDPKIFYHWSPTSRRKAINKRGLVPGSWSTDRLWKPPYVCLAPTAQGAWSLSGAMARGGEVHSPWDLWEVWVGDQSGFEELYYDSGAVKEIRVYERIFKRNIWLVGTR